ncbi:uncharacterized protein LOC116289798 [Actinia tenebrosa]|uniref:Uncharacterized protein LOC116289798 n=1 Tax=Actinia tenebrosa TaxID=6105 RepID=A0A6P8HAH1_ACTTE|nr:uncharacterized protein LOC116289798 [Actinia tenebrosa]
MKLEGRQILFSVFVVLLVNCWMTSAFHVGVGKVGKKKNGKRTEETVRTRTHFQDLCQRAQEQCENFNSDVIEGTNEKRFKVEENPSEVKKSSLDAIITVKTLCNILEQQCESTLDTDSPVKRMSLRSLWRRD